jgi:hypothetical protein
MTRTNSKHGRFVEDIMMRYFEQKVCDFSFMVLETNSKTIERLIAMTGEVPRLCEFLLHPMSDIGYFVTFLIPQVRPAHILHPPLERRNKCKTTLCF